MHVPHFKSSALAAESAGTERREPAFVSNLRQGVGLVHELRKLAAAEKFPYRSHHRFGVNEVMRHRRSHFMVYGHLLLYSALDPYQADTELVLEQFPHCPHSAVAKMVDVINAANIFGQLQSIGNDGVEILRRQSALLQGRVQSELDVELEPTHFGEVVLARITEHSFEERRRRLQRRRISRTLFPVDFNQRIRL